MKIILILSFVLIGSWLTLSAQSEKAYELARKTIGGDIHLMESISKSALVDVEYSIFTNESKAFAIVSSNGEQLLGYSKSAVNWTSMPAALKEILQNYKYKEPSARKKSFYEPIDPMIKTKWGQTWPYNQKTPLVQGINCLTGCTATAIAQVLKYFGEPDYTLSEIPGYTTDIEGEEYELPAIPSGTPLRWDLMLDDYYSNEVNAESIDAVAELMRIVGTMVHMVYGLEGSGAYYFNMLSLSNKCLGFKNCRVVYRDNMSYEDWMKTIYNSFVTNSPILYCGYNDESGHSFILDGIDCDGFVHVNWGWDGAFDGYFDVDILDYNYPGVHEVPNANGFTQGAHMVCDIRPASSVCEPVDHLWSMYEDIILLADQWSDWEYKSSGVTEKDENGDFYISMIANANRENYCDTPDSTYINLAQTTKNGGLKYIEDVKVASHDAYYSFRKLDHKIREEDFNEDGLLYIYLVEKNSEDDQYVFCRDSQKHKLILRLVDGKAVQIAPIDQIGTVSIDPEIKYWGINDGDMLKFNCEIIGKECRSLELIVDDVHCFGSLDADGKMVFDVPKNLGSGRHKGILAITILDYDDYTFTKNIDIQFSINYPSNTIFQPWGDVLAVNNSNNEFIGYQWYKDGELLYGETDQFIKVNGGVNGSYTCRVETKEGWHVFITPSNYTFVADFTISVSPNPTSAGKATTLLIEGLTKEEMAGARLNIHDLSGKLVLAINENLSPKTTVKLNSGSYIATVIANNHRMSSCRIIVQ